MESTTDNTVFEGMFGRALKPTGKFVEDLRAIGYDPARPEIRYPTRVWRDALEVARRHCYPQLPAEQAQRMLGRRFVDGFFETIVGRLMAVAMPLIGTAMVCRRIPKYWAAVRTGISVEVRQESDKLFRIMYRDANPAPDFYAGIIEGAGRYTRTNNVVEIPVRGPDYFELLIAF
jgi:uncharacterized protein (TIGR02265 family)